MNYGPSLQSCDKVSNFVLITNYKAMRIALILAGRIDYNTPVYTKDTVTNADIAGKHVIGDNLHRESLSFDNALSVRNYELDISGDSKKPINCQQIIAAL